MRKKRGRPFARAKIEAEKSLPQIEDKKSGENGPAEDVFVPPKRKQIALDNSDRDKFVASMPTIASGLDWKKKG